MTSVLFKWHKICLMATCGRVLERKTVFMSYNKLFHKVRKREYICMQKLWTSTYNPIEYTELNFHTNMDTLTFRASQLIPHSKANQWEQLQAIINSFYFMYLGEASRKNLHLHFEKIDVKLLSEKTIKLDDCISLILSNNKANPCFAKNIKKIVNLLKKFTNLNLIENTAASSNIFGIIYVFLHSIVHLKPDTVLQVLLKQPKILNLSTRECISLLDILKKINILESHIPKIISKCPDILLLDASEVLKLIDHMHDLNFTRKELQKMLQKYPEILLQSYSELEDKLQYIVSQMRGEDNFDYLTNYGLLRFPLYHIIQRHVFLERRGQFQKPTKHNETSFQNPDLHFIISANTKNFCIEVAKCDVPEFELFKKISDLEELLGKKHDSLEINTENYRDILKGGEDEVNTSQSIKRSFADKLLSNLKS